MDGQIVNIDKRGMGLYLGCAPLGERFIGRIGEDQIFEVFVRLDKVQFENGEHFLGCPYWEMGSMKFSKEDLINVNGEARRILSGNNAKYIEFDKILRRQGI